MSAGLRESQQPSGGAHLVEEDVLGLDVAVDDLATVQERDAPRDVQRNAAPQAVPAQLPRGRVVVDGHPQVTALQFSASCYHACATGYAAVGPSC